jgi:hypothetical protein
MRLRAAGVSLAMRGVLFGHTNGEIASHYSAPELRELIDAAQQICRDESSKGPAPTLLKGPAASDDIAGRLISKRKPGAPGGMNPGTGLRQSGPLNGCKRP